MLAYDGYIEPDIFFSLKKSDLIKRSDLEEETDEETEVKQVTSDDLYHTTDSQKNPLENIIILLYKYR